jgi:2-oxo-4-hydroxy-4-carboxy-5-ureidoimidazoline decarboxylase
MSEDPEAFLKDALSAKPVTAKTREAFVVKYGHLFEHSPWVVERAWNAAPFANAQELHRAFLRVLEEASDTERLSLVVAHPQLADKAALERGLTASSSKEQASAGLDRLRAAEYDSFRDLNAKYRERFGFPFIICVRLHSKVSILAELQRRLSNIRDDELNEALRQIGLISKLRLSDVSP